MTEEVRAMMSALFGAPASDTGVEPLLVRFLEKEYNSVAVQIIENCSILLFYFRFLSHYETREGYYSMLSYVRVSFLPHNTQAQ